MWQFIFLVISVISAFLFNKIYIYQTNQAFDSVRKGDYINLIIYGLPFAILYTVTKILILDLWHGGSLLLWWPMLQVLHQLEGLCRYLSQEEKILHNSQMGVFSNLLFLIVTCVFLGLEEYKLLSVMAWRSRKPKQHLQQLSLKFRVQFWNISSVHFTVRETLKQNDLPFIHQTWR